MKTIQGSIFSVLLGLLSVASAHEASWEEVPDGNRWALSVDMASINRVLDRAWNVSITWRQTQDGKTMETSSTVDCSDFVMVSQPPAEVGMSLFTPPQLEFLKPARRVSPVRYAYYGTVEGAMIDHVCSRVYPNILRLLQQPSVDCEKSPSRSPLLCPGSAHLNANAMLFTLRTRDLVPLCREEVKKAVALHDDIYGEAFDCKDQQCAEEAISYGLLLVSRDLEGARAAEMAHEDSPANCYAVTSLSERITDRLQADALRRYRDCLLSKLTDFKITTADSKKAARVVHGMCLREFGEATAEFGHKLSDEEYYARQEPNLIKLIERRKQDALKAK